MPVDFDPYAVLGVPNNATLDEIRDAYRRAARRLHPDKQQGNPGAAAQFTDITAAYNLLLNPSERFAYDEEARKRPADALTFSLRVTPSKRNLLPLTEPQVVYMLAEILPDPRAKEMQEELRQQTHVNLTLVLDKSNSMSGRRIERVQRAALKIIDHLSPQDILSVVAFNDHADVIIPATMVTDKPGLKARITMLKPFGGTEIYRGLSAGVEQNRKFLAPRLVNHVILLTDGNTYGDQDRCISLAQQVTQQGIGISALGLGDEWNDKFLDQLASVTGGTSSYIKSSSAVVSFLDQHVRSLSNVFAERLTISVAPDIGVKLESAFKLTPHPQSLPANEGVIPLGALQISLTTSILLQFELPANMAEGYRSIARMVAAGDILANDQRRFQALSDTSLGINSDPPKEETPPAILDALGRLTLYRMQERAQDALEEGDFIEATSRLEKLATRLFQLGEPQLAEQVRTNARQVASTQTLSSEGRKTLKYHTRNLLGGSSSGDADETDDDD